MRKLKGTITSTKMQKTVVVRVDRLKKHFKYQKYYRVSKKFKAHVENGEYRLGDKVIIQETRPTSKDKRWKVVKFVKGFETGQQAEETPEIDKEVIL